MQKAVTSLFHPDELYEIETTLEEGMLLNVSTSQQYKMIIYQRSNADNEKFRIIQHTSGKYQIISKFQGKEFAIQVPSGSNQDGERIQARPWDNHINEKWEIEPVGKGIYFIKSNTGLYLNVQNSGTSNGTHVNQSVYNGGKKQIWYIKPLLNLNPNGFDPKVYYEIETSLAPGMLLHADDYKMIIKKGSESEKERFRIIQLSAGKFQIVCQIWGKEYALQVPSGSNQNGERIQIRQKNNQPNESWEIVPTANGLYMIKSLWGLNLDVQNSGTSNGIKVNQKSLNAGGKNQLWYIKPALGHRPQKQPIFNPNIQYEIETLLVSGKLLQASHQQNLKMIIHDRCKTENERFRIVPVGKGNYQVISNIQGKDYYLTVPMSSNDPRERLQMKPLSNQFNQYWEFLQGAKDKYTIKAFNGQVVDVHSSRKENGAPVIQFPSHGGYNQTWIVLPAK